MRDARLPARQKLNISDDYEIHEKKNLFAVAKSILFLLQSFKELN